MSVKENKFNSEWLCIAFPLREDKEGNPREGYASADFRFLDKDTPESREFKTKQLDILRRFAESPGKIEVKEANGKVRFVLTTAEGMERNSSWAKSKDETPTRRSI